MTVGGEEIVMSSTGHQVRVIGFMQERIQEEGRVKWKQIYWEREIFHRQNGDLLRKWEWPQGMGWLVFMDWVIACCKESEEYSYYSREESRSPGTGILPTFWSFMVYLGILMVYKRLVLSIIMKIQWAKSQWPDCSLCHLAFSWFQSVPSSFYLILKTAPLLH